MPAPGDHPRACGVYGCVAARVASSSGSSPRVRGLHPDTETDACMERIIPARAGFTRQILCRQEILWDHPRACGVYGKGVILIARRFGSSPRVRGLPVLSEGLNV